MEALQPKTLRIEVTDRVPGVTDPAFVDLWLFLPESNLDVTPRIAFGFPGGTYTKSYFHQEIPGHDNYSMASWLVNRGIIFVACDHLATTGSPNSSSPIELTESQVIRCDRVIVEEVLTRLAEGSLVEDFAPILDPLVIGVGHSLGGFLTVKHQARFRSFDAIAVLGWSHAVPGEIDPNASTTAEEPTFALDASLDPI